MKVAIRWFGTFDGYSGAGHVGYSCHAIIIISVVYEVNVPRIYSVPAYAAVPVVDSTIDLCLVPTGFPVHRIMS